MATKGRKLHVRIKAMLLVESSLSDLHTLISEICRMVKAIAATSMKLRLSCLLCLSRSVTVKDVKALLPQVNYRVPNLRFLKDKLQVTIVF